MMSYKIITTMTEVKDYSKLILSVTSDDGDSFWVMYEFFLDESTDEPFASGIRDILKNKDVRTSPIMLYVDSDNHSAFKDVLEGIVCTEIKYNLFQNDWVEDCNDFLVLQVHLAKRYH